MVDEMHLKTPMAKPKPLNYRWIVLSTTFACHLLLAACQTTTPEPRIEVREVKVAVPVPCDPDPKPQKPVLPDHTTAPDIFEGVKRLLVRDRLREAYEGELEAALEVCAGR